MVFAGAGQGSYWSYGNYVEIDHENGLHTIYAHCSSLNVKVGDRVEAGESLAEIHASTPEKANEAAERLRACYRLSETPVERPAIIKEIIR